VTGADFDIDAFLTQPLTARVATNGPTVRLRLRPTSLTATDLSYRV
jgi:hypothetical protein